MAGVLRGERETPPHIHRLGPHALQAGRRSDYPAPWLLARGRRPQSAPAHAQRRRESGRHFRDDSARGHAHLPSGTQTDLGRMARHHAHEGKGILTRPLRRALSQQLSGCVGSRRRRGGGVRQRLARRRPHGDIRRPHALHVGRTRWSGVNVWTRLLFALLALGCAPAHSAYIPRDPELRLEPLYFYPGVGTSRHPKAGVFFLGNDLGFWEPHQKLAERLAAHGYAVVGFDVKKFLDRLPDSALLRDSILVHDLPGLIERSLHELGADSVPIVIAGHSFGADLALWAEANARLPGVVGVLALSPTRRDHPTVTLKDQMNTGEPTGPGSFAVA